MTTARNHDTPDGPAGWMILLGLMVLALVIAWSAKGCGDDNSNSNLGLTQTTGTSTASSAAGQQVVEEITTVVTQSGGIQFEAGKADLTAGSEGTLDQVATILSRNPDVNIIIAGHTDTQGDAADNKALSQRRADAVRDYLVVKGIAQTRLTPRGYGEEEPLVANDTTEEARAQNRRVEFLLTS